MARDREVTTRVDQLHADLRRVRQVHTAQAGAPPEPPRFTTHADGSVWDDRGHQVRPPTPVKP